MRKARRVKLALLVRLVQWARRVRKASRAIPAQLVLLAPALLLVEPPDKSCAKHRQLTMIRHGQRLLPLQPAVPIAT